MYSTYGGHSSYEVINSESILLPGVRGPIFTEFHLKVNISAASSKGYSILVDVSSFWIMWYVRGPADPVVMCPLMHFYCCKVGLLVRSDITQIPG